MMSRLKTPLMNTQKIEYIVKVIEIQMMMKISSVVLVVMVALLVVAAPMVKAVTTNQCKNERTQLVNECRPVIFGQDPSNNCCQRVRVIHVDLLISLILHEQPNKSEVVEETFPTTSNVAVRLFHDDQRKCPRSNLLSFAFKFMSDTNHVIGSSTSVLCWNNNWTIAFS
ncbi:hypothetical protein F8388_018156 [Cannabis sativa]|uniref:Bifunctional inhibitor/plant lipid transfer protein/seed storage helical domain-containing protein n=1 Tax=Cannabis sativa TaxID=3483 RepID=A0A7J6GB57_CANSA|nr:hypothetical protein F8388_018156 [Cannabis sativa]